MELKERTTLYMGNWDVIRDDTEAELAAIELDEPDADLKLTGPVLAGLASGPDFLSDEAYLELYQRYQTERQAEREVALARARAQAQAQAVKAVPPPPPSPAPRVAPASNGHEAA